MTCWTGFCINRKPRYYMQNKQESEKEEKSNAAKFILQAGGEIDL